MKNAFALVLTLLCFSAFSQISDDGKSVQVVSYWDKNESHTYSVITETADIKGADTTVTESIKCKVDVKVIDSTATSYTIQWTYRDFEVTSKNPAVEKIAKLNEGLTLQIRTSELGAFSELINWSDVKKFNEAAVKLAESDPQSSKLKNYLLGFKEKYSTKEAIEVHSIKDVKLFYDLFGISMNMDAPIDTEASDYNPIVKENMVSNIRAELVEIDLEDRHYLIAYHQVFDKKSSLMLLKKLMAGTVPQDVLDGVKHISLEDSSATQMHESGWPISMYFQRAMTLDGVNRIDSREIILEN